MQVLFQGTIFLEHLDTCYIKIKHNCDNQQYSVKLLIKINYLLKNASLLLIFSLLKDPVIK